jgi:hypothetical protein
VYFEGRELRPGSQPVSAAELKEGTVYFAINYVDEDMLIPVVETLVFIGKNLLPDDVGKAYFQDVESYRQGVLFKVGFGEGSVIDGGSHNSNALEPVRDAEVDSSPATFFCGSENELNHIFKYEAALDELIKCSLRRKEAGA